MRTLASSQKIYKLKEHKKLLLWLFHFLSNGTNQVNFEFLLSPFKQNKSFLANEKHIELHRPQCNTNKMGVSQ